METPRHCPPTLHAAGPVTFPSRSCSGRKNWWEKTLSPGGQLPGVWWPGGPGREDRREEGVTGGPGHRAAPRAGGQLSPRPHGAGISLTCCGSQLPIAWLRSQKVLLEVVASGGQRLGRGRVRRGRTSLRTGPCPLSALHPWELSTASLHGPAKLAPSKRAGQDVALLSSQVTQDEVKM